MNDNNTKSEKFYHTSQSFNHRLRIRQEIKKNLYNKTAKVKLRKALPFFFEDVYSFMI